MSENIKKEDVLSNLIWRFAERCGAQMVSFIVSIVLARLLEPSLYGTVALIYVFIAIVQVFVDSGFGNALIQKKDADDLDFSSVFYTNIVLCLFLYTLLFFSAPLISTFYRDLSMIPMIRVLGLTIVISGVKNVQQAYVSKNLLFKKFFYATLGGTVCAGIVGIELAYKGAGAWALVAQQVTNIFIDTCVLWVVVKWRPKKMFSFSRLRSMFSFGWKLLASNLIYTYYNNLRSMIIGRLYSSADLAYYDKGYRLPELVVTNINFSIDSVLLPTMSSAQDTKERIKKMCKRSMRTAIYLMAPFMIGLFAVAEPLVRLLFTEKWIGCIFYMRIFCVTLMFYPIHTTNLNAIKAVGRSDIFLKLEIVKMAIGLLALISTMWISVEAMALSTLFTTIISIILNAHPNKKLLDYGVREQIRDIAPSILLAVIMGCIVLPISYLCISDIFKLIFQIIMGVIIYIAGSKIFKIDSYEYLLNTIKALIESRKCA